MSLSNCIFLINDANSAEYLRTRARFGKNSFGIRVMNTTEFAEFLLTRAGIPITKKAISFDEQVAIIARLKNSLKYFSSSSYSDAGNIASALNSLRELITDNEKEVITGMLSKGEFPDKNKALLELYNAYTDYCSENNLMDSVAYRRKALSESGKIHDVPQLFLGRHFTGLDFRLAEVFSGGSFSYLNHPDIENVNREEAAHVKNPEFISAYGQINEDEYILSEILENNIPLDKCTVAVTDTAGYGQLFYDRCTALGIPVTFGCGVPVSNSKVAGFLSLLSRWDSDGFNGIDALRNLIFSGTFNISKANEILGEGRAKWDDIITTAGNLRLSTSAEDNRKKISAYISSLEESEGREKDKNLLALKGAEKLFAEFEKGYSHIIKTFAYISPDPSSPAGKIDRSAISTITSAIDFYLEYSGKDDPSEIIPGLLKKSVCSELSREGALHITDINGAAYAMRENIFIAGLSASKFPGVPKENYLVLDSDYALCSGSGFVPDEIERPVSFRITEDKINDFKFLIETAEACRADIHISYPDFDFADLKPDEPSSVFSKYLENVTAASGETEVRNAGFFTLDDGKNCRIGRAASEGKEILPDEKNPGEYVMPGIENTSAYITSSSAHTFTECPKQYLFEKILDLKPAEVHDPFTVIDAASLGTLLHSAMEFRGDRDISEDEFLKYCDKLFEDFLLSRPPLHEADKEAAKNDFISLSLKAFRLYKDKSVALSEDYIEYTDDRTEITAGGYPDRINYDADTDSYTVVDFKSGRNISQKTDNFDSCIQTLLYAYVYSKLTGNNVTGVEYRYPRYSRSITHKFNADIAEDIEEYIFTAMYESLKTGNFKAKPGSTCRNCKYKVICGEAKK